MNIDLENNRVIIKTYHSGARGHEYIFDISGCQTEELFTTITLNPDHNNLDMDSDLKVNTELGLCSMEKQKICNKKKISNTFSLLWFLDWQNKRESLFLNTETTETNRKASAKIYKSENKKEFLFDNFKNYYKNKKICSSDDKNNITFTFREKFYVFNFNMFLNSFYNTDEPEKNEFQKTLESFSNYPGDQSDEYSNEDNIDTEEPLNEQDNQINWRKKIPNIFISLKTNLDQKNRVIFPGLIVLLFASPFVIHYRKNIEKFFLFYFPVSRKTQRIQ